MYRILYKPNGVWEMWNKGEVVTYDMAIKIAAYMIAAQVLIVEVE